MTRSLIKQDCGAFVNKPRFLQFGDDPLPNPPHTPVSPFPPTTATRGLRIVKQHARVGTNPRITLTNRVAQFLGQKPAFPLRCPCRARRRAGFQPAAQTTESPRLLRAVETALPELPPSIWPRRFRVIDWCDGWGRPKAPSETKVGWCVPGTCGERGCNPPT